MRWNRSIIALLGILILGGSLRLWGINHELYTDENKVVTPSENMAKGAQEPLLYPRGSYYPHLYHYVLAGMFWPLQSFEAAAPAGTYHNIYLLAARIITALIGTATIGVVYAIGKKLQGDQLGLIAALLLAVVPIHVKYSHYAHVDIPLTFFSALVLWSGISLWQRPSTKWYLLTGLFVGLAASVHYPGFALGIILLIAHFRHVWNSTERLRTLLRPAFLGALILIPLSFAATSPYFLIDWRQSLATYQKLNQRALTGDLGYTRTNMLWPLYTETPDWGLPFTRTGLFWELYPVVFVLTLIGVGIAIHKRRWDLVLLLFGTAVVLYLSISGYVRMTAIKRLLPVTPALVLLAAFAIRSIAKEYPWGKIVSTAAALLVVAGSVWQVGGFNRAYVGGSTHAQATAWAEANIPERSIVLQHTPIMLLNWSDPRFKLVRMEEVYASFNPADPEVSHDRATPLDDWVVESGVQFVVMDSRIVDRYYDATSVQLYPETTASYQAFFDEVRQRGKRVYSITPKLWEIAGPRVEIYDVRNL